MRDGVKLFTIIYCPKDTSKPYPILLERTPYSVGPYGPNNFGRARTVQQFRQGGLHRRLPGRARPLYVRRRVRRNAAAHPGQAGPKDIDESTDTYDTIDWLVKNIPNNNGKVGMWGISYPGFYTGRGMIDAHPALKASSPQAPVDGLVHGRRLCTTTAAFFLQQQFSFISSVWPGSKPDRRSASRGAFKLRALPDGYEFFLHLGPLRQRR